VTDDAGPDPKESMINASQTHQAADDEGTTMTPETILSAIVELASDRMAQDIVSMDLRAMSGFADYFVICSGRSDRQCKAIHDAIHLGMKSEHGLLPGRVEGLPEGRWILMDYLDVVVHVFTPETRERYRLEQLWGEAPSTRLESAATDA
jgi:ribosome-associated protein